jgi:hypothetical protein
MAGGFTHSIAGGAGDLVIATFQSPNYVPGVSGWQVTIEGNAEFNDAVFRGVVIATEFAAQVAVSAGSYSGEYTIESGQATDQFGNQTAVIEWLNGTSPAVSPPYAAGANGAGAGSLFSVHSGWQDSGDAESGLYLLSADASETGNPLAILDCEDLQPFGGSGPTLSQDGAGMAVDTWNAITLDSGWTAGAQPPQYRFLPDGNVQVRGQATHSGITAATNINGSHPIPSAYWPGQTRIYRPPDQGDAAATVDITTVGIFVARASGFTATAVAMDGTYSI